jgi:hypothetical protein
MARWLLWTAVLVGSVAALTTIRGLNHHPKSASLNMAIEVFLGGQAQIDRLKHYLRSHGVSVDDLKS